jgi:FkbH-like protein
MKSIKVVSISDYTATSIISAVKKFSAEDNIQIEQAGVFFGVRQQIMMTDQDAIERSVVLCLPLPEFSLDTFNRRLNGDDVSYAEVLDEVDFFYRQLQHSLKSASSVLVGSWLMPYFTRGLGLLDLQSDLGTKRLIWQMNERLAKLVDDTIGWYLLDSERWLMQPNTGYSSRNYFAAKLPFTADTFHAAGRDVAFAIKAIIGRSAKLVVVDLDNTIWGGVVGDDGWENLKLGGHHSVGEAFVDFQRYLKSLTKRGVLLAVASKNDESIAWEAFEKNPYMLLKKDDFAAWRINWNDKAENIADMVNELNIGLQSVVFIDDNLSERTRVKEALPEVNVIELPLSPTLYREVVERYGNFDQASFTKEDDLRSKSYTIETKRKDFQAQFNTHEDWLRSLKLTAEVQQINKKNLERVVQLLNKTNQMNLSTRRLTASELEFWLEKPENEMRAFSICDRFGEYGLTGLVSFTREQSRIKIVDFILSCRVFGRKVEDLMLSVAFEIAAEKGAEQAYAIYCPTAKNKPTLDFFQSRSGMTGLNLLDKENIVFETNQINLKQAPEFFDVHNS